MTREKAKVADHEIGGVSVKMTAAQAERWNSGNVTERDLDTITAFLLDESDDHYMTLRRATNARLEPISAKMMDGMPANRCGDWK